MKSTAIAPLFLLPVLFPTLLPGAVAAGPSSHSTPSAVAPTSVAGISWEPSVEAAYERAAAEGRILFLAVNMDGERANERMVNKVYGDKVVTALAAETVNMIASPSTHRKKGACPRFDGIECDEHRFVDVEVRKSILKGDASGAVVAPQHVFLRADGTVILSVPFEVSGSELEWCFHAAMDVVDEARAEGTEPLPRPKRSRKERRPRRLIMGDVIQLGSSSAAAITREEALEIVKELKKGASTDDLNAKLRRLVSADEPEAIEYVMSVMRAGGRGGGGGGGGRGGGGGGGGGASRGLNDDQKVALMSWIGAVSPMSYWEVAADFADSGAASLQAESVVTLEQLGSPEALSLLHKALRRAKDPKEKKNILRALGACAQDDKKTRTALLKGSADRKEPLIRANAILGLGWLDADEKVAARLMEALLPDAHTGKATVDKAKLTEEERVAAAVAMGISRSKVYRAALAGLSEDDDEPESVRKAASAAVKAIDGEKLSVLTESLRLAGGDKLSRDRYFPVTLGGADR